MPAGRERQRNVVMRPLARFAAMTEGENSPQAPRSARLPLSAHDVDIWRVALDHQPGEAVKLMASLLSRDETERASRFYFERDRRRYIVGRGVLRMTLGRYVGQ